MIARYQHIITLKEGDQKRVEEVKRKFKKFKLSLTRIFMTGVEYYEYQVAKHEEKSAS